MDTISILYVKATTQAVFESMHFLENVSDSYPPGMELYITMSETVGLIDTQGRVTLKNMFKKSEPSKVKSIDSDRMAALRNINIDNPSEVGGVLSAINVTCIVEDNGDPCLQILGFEQQSIKDIHCSQQLDYRSLNWFCVQIERVPKVVEVANLSVYGANGIYLYGHFTEFTAIAVNCTVGRQCIRVDTTSSSKDNVVMVSNSSCNAVEKCFYIGVGIHTVVNIQSSIFNHNGSAVPQEAHSLVQYEGQAIRLINEEAQDLASTIYNTGLEDSEPASAQLAVTNCTFINYTSIDFGIAAKYADKLTVNNCSAINYSGKHSFIFAENVRSVNVTDLHVSNCTSLFNGCALSARNAEKVTAKALVITSANAPCGGAIMSEKVESLKIIDSQFTKNSALQGGALCVTGTEHTKVDQVQFQQNFAANSGGAVFVDYDSVNMVFWGMDYKVRTNAVRYHREMMEITDCKFKRNSAQDGGAIQITGVIKNLERLVALNSRSYDHIYALWSIYSSLFQGNTANTTGGGISVHDFAGMLAIEDSKFIGNNATEGGGLALVSENVTDVALRLANVQASNNYAAEVGGFVAIQSTILLYIQSSTFNSNTAEVAGGVVACAGCLGVFIGPHLQVDLEEVFEKPEINPEQLPVVMKNNSACIGGAVLCAGCSLLSMLYTEMNSNTAWLGGAVFSGRSNGLLVPYTKTVFVNQSEFIDNRITAANVEQCATLQLAGGKMVSSIEFGYLPYPDFKGSVQALFVDDVTMFLSNSTIHSSENLLNDGFLIYVRPQKSNTTERAVQEDLMFFKPNEFIFGLPAHRCSYAVATYADFDDFVEICKIQANWRYSYLVGHLPVMWPPQYERVFLLGNVNITLNENSPSIFFDQTDNQDLPPPVACLENDLLADMKKEILKKMRDEYPYEGWSKVIYHSLYYSDGPVFYEDYPYVGYDYLENLFDQLPTVLQRRELGWCVSKDSSGRGNGTQITWSSRSTATTLDLPQKTSVANGQQLLLPLINSINKQSMPILPHRALGVLKLTPSAESKNKLTVQGSLQALVQQDQDLTAQISGPYGDYSFSASLPLNSNVQPVNVTIRIRPCQFGEINKEVLDMNISECQQCSVSYYSYDAKNSTKSQCKVCPGGAFCPGGSQAPVLLPENGYWHSSLLSPQIHLCKNKDACISNTTYSTQMATNKGRLNFQVNSSQTACEGQNDECQDVQQYLVQQSITDLVLKYVNDKQTETVLQATGIINESTGEGSNIDCPLSFEDWCHSAQWNENLKKLQSSNKSREDVNALQMEYQETLVVQHILDLPEEYWSNCAYGYTGVLCAGCEDGKSKSIVQKHGLARPFVCKSCTNTASQIIFSVLAGSAILIPTTMSTIWSNIASGRQDYPRLSDHIKQIVLHLQLGLIVFEVGVPLPRWLTKSIDTLTASVTVTQGAAGCIYNSSSSLSQGIQVTIFKLFLPLVVFSVAYFVVYFLSMSMRRYGQRATRLAAGQMKTLQIQVVDMECRMPSMQVGTSQSDSSGCINQAGQQRQQQPQRQQQQPQIEFANSQTSKGTTEYQTQSLDSTKQMQDYHLHIRQPLPHVQDESEVQEVPAELPLDLAKHTQSRIQTNIPSNKFQSKLQAKAKLFADITMYDISWIQLLNCLSQFYPVVVFVTILSFSCINADSHDDNLKYPQILKSTHDKGYWVSDVAMPCFEGQHLTYAVVMGVFGIPLLCIAPPLFLFCIVRFNHKRLHQVPYQRKLLSLYHSYKDKWVYWEAIKLVQLFWLATVRALLATATPSLQYSVLLFLLVALLLINIGIRPYRFKMLNVLEMCIFGANAFCVYLLTFLVLDDSQGGVRQDSLGHSVIASVIALAYFSLLVALIAKFLQKIGVFKKLAGFCTSNDD